MPAGRSWGGYPAARQRIVRIERRDAPLPVTPEPILAYGNGRSYGDACLNDGGVLLHTRGLDRFIAFDAQRGILRCEAGVLLSEILDFALTRGWILPVLPGTQFVTVGGAIANDVHGQRRLVSRHAGGPGPYGSRHLGRVAIAAIGRTVGQRGSLAFSRRRGIPGFVTRKRNHTRTRRRLD